MGGTEPDEDASTAEVEQCLRCYRERAMRSLGDPKFVLEVLGFIVLLVYAIYTIKMFYANRDAADAALSAAKSAEAGISLARPNAHFDQRAWLSISYGTYKYVINQAFGATYEVTDTGKTPARNVNGKSVTRFMKNGEIPSFTYEHKTSADLGTMFPNVHQGAISWLIPASSGKEQHVQPMRISDEIFRALQDGRGYMMIYGNITYDSVFGAHHWIKFCAASGPTRFTEPKQCIDYNDVDSNEEP